MSKKILFPIALTVLSLSWNFCTAGTINESPDLSFAPTKICKKSTIHPPKTLLRRTYRTYMKVDSWAIYDINGDGWCDWIRGGHEGYRTDVDSPPMRDFIYLGTHKGWRHFDQSKLEKKSKVEIYKDDGGNILSEEDNAYNFYQPIAVYNKELIKPYIASVVRMDAPAPAPNRDQIEVFQWNDQLDKLLKVPEKVRISVIDFLHDQLCKNPPALMDGDGPFIITMGDLCTPRN